MKSFDSKTKAMTKRVMANSPVIMISDQGDVCNHETTVWRGDRRARRWVSVETRNHPSRQALILGADSLSLDDESVLVRSGTRTTRLDAKTVETVIPAMLKPGGKSSTFDAWRGENRDAVKALYSTIAHNDMFPLLSTVKVTPSGASTVTAVSTDRYRATRATLETTSKPVEFSTLVRRFLIREVVFNRAWHLTVWKDFSIAEFCDTGVRVQTRNFEPLSGGEYPEIESLFIAHEGQRSEWTVTPPVFGRVVRNLNPPTHSPFALSRDGQVAADGSGVFRPAGVVSTSVTGEPAKWVAFNPEYLAPMVQSLSGYSEVRISWNEEMKPVNIVASERVWQMIMPSRGAGRSFPVVGVLEL